MLNLSKDVEATKIWSIYVRTIFAFIINKILSNGCNFSIKLNSVKLLCQVISKLFEWFGSYMLSSKFENVIFPGNPKNLKDFGQFYNN